MYTGIGSVLGIGCYASSGIRIGIRKKKIVADHLYYPSYVKCCVNVCVCGGY